MWLAPRPKCGVTVPSATRQIVKPVLRLCASFSGTLLLLPKGGCLGAFSGE